MRCLCRVEHRTHRAFIASEREGEHFSSCSTTAQALSSVAVAKFFRRKECESMVTRQLQPAMTAHALCLLLHKQTCSDEGRLDSRKGEKCCCPRRTLPNRWRVSRQDRIPSFSLANIQTIFKRRGYHTDILLHERSSRRCGAPTSASSSAIVRAACFSVATRPNLLSHRRPRPEHWRG